jgi:glycerophosphoryl diester phosphodiesterase
MGKLAIGLVSLHLIVAPVLAVDVVAHRGANEVAPENTYAAAEVCIEWGIEYVEIDVRTSADGVMYILHDSSVDRTTDGSGKIHELSSGEIDRLDAGSWKDAKYAGQRVPRLDEYLRWIKGKAKVYFDVKAADLEELIKLVYDTGLEEDCFFWFGNPIMARQFRQLDTDLPLKVNVKDVEGVQRAATKDQANIVEVGLSNMTPELLAACRDHGLAVMAYHPQKDADAFREVIRRGADMINLNHGDLFKRVERELADEP